ncbi:MAG: N-acetylmuramoyl-L-alanine amidase [Treponemataceae bacterium]|nr:N-acetylmuramoyl-L-alanine amidase [Spirochaetales bacterium]MDY6031531.1 N-acetylmuramoyl-L-alanine amidase [Treponemataceae bacterium]
MLKKFSTFFLILTFTFSIFALTNQTVPENYVSLVESAEKINAKLYFDPLSYSCTLQKNGNVYSFRIDDEIAVLNFRQFKAIDRPIKVDNEIFVSQSMIDDANILFLQKKVDENFRIGVILIDPGHGGKDPGTIGNVIKDGKKQHLYEKDIVLSVGNELASMLRMKYPDKRIIMTRSTDVYLTLEQRVDIANSVKLEENEAVIYISIHANSSFKSDASGFEVWYLSPGYRRNVIGEKDVDDDLRPILNSMLEEEYTTESILMAKFIHDGLDKQVGAVSKSRGLKAEEWFVVRNSYMPSVLVEVGFVSNSAEAYNLSDPSYLHKISVGLYNGVGSFVTHFEQSRGFTTFQ